MTLDQVHKAKSILLSIVAVLTGLLFLSLDWAPRIDFDVTGFLFLLGNAGRLTSCCFRRFQRHGNLLLDSGIPGQILSSTAERSPGTAWIG